MTPKSKPMPQSKSQSKYATRTLAACLTGLLLVSGCGQGGDKAKADKAKGEKANKGGDRALQAVAVGPIEMQNFAARLVVAGQVQGIQEARVFPTSSGARVLQILADAGDQVAAGQALVRLDARQISADSELLSAQVRRARTALAEAEVGLTTARLSLTRAQNGAEGRESILSTRQAELALEQAQSEYSRANAVKDAGALSQEQTEARRIQAELAAARVRGQRADAAAIIESRRQGVAQAQARVEASRADLQVAIAQQAQSDSRQNNGLITAPVSGLVIARNVKVGEIAGSTGQPMFTIVAGNALELAAEVSEGDLARLSLGMRAQFTAPDGSPVYGILRRLPAQIDPTRRTGIARFTLDSNPSVKAGVFLTGSATSTGRGVPAIPASALVYGPEGASIFVLRSNDSVRKAPVVLGGRQGQLVELVNGPPMGTMIVTSGSSFLAEGEKMNPVRGVPNAIAAPTTPPAPSNVPAKN